MSKAKVPAQHVKDALLQPDVVRLRACFRASARYLLMAQSASTDASEGDVTAAVIMIAVMCANVSQLDRDAPGRFAHYDDPPPDELRQPAVALKVARRLGLPRETVRRRLSQLVAAGRCRRRSGGYLVPQSVIANEHHLATARTNFSAIVRLRRDVGEGGAEPWPPLTPSAGARHPRPPLRLINRHVAEYSLDVVTPLAKLTGGYDEAFVYLAAVEATWRATVSGNPPSVSGYILAHSLGLPDESARRRLKKLVALGLLQQGPGGYTAVTNADRASDLERIHLANYAALRRLFGALDADGVDLTADV